MATEFISVIKSSGGEYTTLNLWHAALNAQTAFNLRPDVDVVRVYSISNAGTFADNATLAYTGTAGGHCIHMNAAKTQMLVFHHTAGEHFATGGSITSVGQTATVTSTIGGGEGDHAIAVAEIDGEITHTVAYAPIFNSESTTARTDTTHRLVIRSLGKAKRPTTDVALRYGTAAGRILYDLTSASSTAMLALGSRYLTIEDIDIIDTDATHTGPVVNISGQASASMEVVLNRVIVQAGSGATTTQAITVTTTVDGPVKINNSLFYSTPAANGRCAFFEGDNVTVTNSAFFSLGDTHAIGVVANAGAATFTNCYARAGGDHAAWSGTYGTFSYCASNDATGTPSGLRAKLFSGDNFEGVEAGEEDFRIKEASELVGLGVGVADTGLAEDEDIFGSARPAGYEDVGPMEWAGAEPEYGTGYGTLPAIEGEGQSSRSVPSSGSGTLPKVSATGLASKLHFPSGGGTLGAVEHPSASVITSRRASGSGSLYPVTAHGEVLSAPTDLHCNNTDASGGTNNPTDIAVTEPHFSCVVGILDSNIVDVEIQVSSDGDSDWSDAVKWDSGWLTLSTPRATAGRTADITYLQEA